MYEPNANWHYLTINGDPVCKCGRRAIDTATYCEHPTKASAQRAKKKLQATYQNVRVVPGRCPIAVPQGA